MYQYTTPTITITIPEALDVSEITALVVVLQQGPRSLEKTLDDSNVQLDTENNAITITLTQEETGAFEAGTVKIQCHILVGNTAYATNEMIAPIHNNLHKEVIA